MAVEAMLTEVVPASCVEAGDFIRVSDHQWGTVTSAEQTGAWMLFIVDGYCRWSCRPARRVVRRLRGML